MSKSSFSKETFRVFFYGAILITLFYVLAGFAAAQSTESSENSPPDDNGNGGAASTNTSPPEPIVDWQKKQDQTGRLEALGTGLLGDKIEPHTGALSFEHTDIVLPGNSSLDVSIRRRIKTGALYRSDVKAEFGDWELITPRIKVTTASASNYRTGNRCSANDPLQMIQVPYPEVVSNSSGSSTVQKNRDTYSNEYSNGYTLDVPGYGSQPMLKHG